MNQFAPCCAGLFVALMALPALAQVNLALVGKPSASYVSGDTSLAALNDGIDPRTSRDRRNGSYGNWNRRGTQWVEYEWSQPISADKIDVYWWNDNQGVRTPAACRIMYWDGDGFTSVINGTDVGLELDQYNTATFEEVVTTRLRLEIDSAAEYSTGILEWKVGN